jgi:hypothetical protein
MMPNLEIPGHGRPKTMDQPHRLASVPMTINDGVEAAITAITMART